MNVYGILSQTTDLEVRGLNCEGLLLLNEACECKELDGCWNLQNLGLHSLVSNRQRSNFNIIRLDNQVFKYFVQSLDRILMLLCLTLIEHRLFHFTQLVAKFVSELLFHFRPNILSFSIKLQHWLIINYRTLYSRIYLHRFLFLSIMVRLGFFGLLVQVLLDDVNKPHRNLHFLPLVVVHCSKGTDVFKPILHQNLYEFFNIFRSLIDFFSHHKKEILGRSLV